MTIAGKIPFLDLVTLHAELEAELVSVFRSALKTCAFIGGPMLEEFERDFAALCEAEYCVGVGSGTDALRFALIAAGVKPGDTVITVPNTFIATTEAITQAGAAPDFVDIDERTYNMDGARLEEYLHTRCRRDPSTGQWLNQKTRRPVTAIVPVHLYGQPANMDRLQEIAEQHDLIVIEDACQAHGAEYFSQRENCWRRAGAMGRAGTFSFYPGKNLGACGEAGAVTTNDRELARRVRVVRVYHLYVIRVKNRDRVQEYLAQSDIGTQIHYPIPLHLQEAHADLGYAKGDFPIAERVATEILSLPIYPGLNADQQRRVVQTVLESPAILRLSAA